MLKILIADDHAIVRKGLRQIILEEYPAAFIGEASEAATLIHEVMNQRWDVVICDMNMPGRSGLDALGQIKQVNPTLPVLIMSMYPENQYAIRVLKAGAAGYLSKDSVHEDLVKAIQMVLKGRKYITPGIAEQLADSVHRNDRKMPHETLSDREFDVFKLLASGKSVSQIAEEISLGVTTVSTYRARILQKMNLPNNAGIIKYAMEHNLF
ncbi:response regulator transcription factor [Flavihumibacter solisilvae]|uniref:LuxR family transcriptional regulator n=1 Tax=Flavihumibacter solisilvae TaxID=1349421 RepID=A0A0C1LHK0_9BACT|nr:response regulator transcription factor [Flavihumibacter solisilvae]KIC94833.1 LuxR family transcriptional regulator [Flavihumibacter solisilvae]